MKQKLLSLLFVFTCAIGVTFSQTPTRTVTGRVTSASDGSPVSGVSVSVAGSSVSTQTDGVGNYSISVSQNATLIFSYVGYTTQRVSVGSRTSVNVSLVLDDEAIEEVVVTGYGQIRREQFAGAATQLSAADVTENRPVGSFNQVLQGRAPGVLVNSGTGQPGRNATIRIRGVQSIQAAGAQPLYVVDGVPIDEDTFQTLNPNDFESLTVLKDANSAAMYGARAGVGVIVITTKQGRTGATEITARVQLGATAAPDFSRLNLMNTEQLLDYQEFIGSITSTNTVMPGWYWSRNNPANANRTEAELQRFDFLLDSVRSIQTDLRDILFRTGVSQMYELVANGGTDKTRFFGSASYFNQEGIDRTSGLERFTGRVNLSHDAGRLKLQWNTLGGYSILTQAVGDIYGNSPINPFQMIYRGMPYDNPYRADGSVNFGAGHTALNTRQIANVLERGWSTMDPVKQMKVNTGLTLSYDLTDDIQLRSVFGLDASSTLRETYIDPGSFSGSQQTFQNGWARENQHIYSQLINTSSINYNKALDERHSFSAGLYFEGLRVNHKGMGFELFNLNPKLPWTGQGAADLPTEGNPTMPQRAASASSGYGIRSFFGNVEYSFDNRITVNANLRHDGTSRILNRDNRQILTWSAGAIWNLANESFMQNQDFLSRLNLRASYGITPNIGSIIWNTYTIQGASALAANQVPNYGAPQVPSFGTTGYTGSSIPAIVPLTPGNPNLKIERIHKANVGLDAAAWDNRATLSLDFYRNRTIDLFVQQPLSATSGFSNLNVNAGEMSNKGVEAMVGVDVVRTGDINLNLGAQHAVNINRIDDLGTVEQYFLGTFLIKEGLPYGSHYATDYLGADPQTGRPLFRTEDGGTVDDVAQAPTFAEFGTFIPKHTGAFTFDFRYKRFSVSSLFSYQFDVVRSNNTRNWITRGTVGYAVAVNQSTELIGNQWSQPGDEAFYQSPAFDRGFTSADLQNAKFFRWRELRAAYTIPGANLANGNSIFKGATVYANLHNLAIWSPWNGVDPEDNNNISLVEYPNPRMFVFGVDFRF